MTAKLAMSVTVPVVGFQAAVLKLARSSMPFGIAQKRMPKVQLMPGAKVAVVTA